MIVRKPNFSQHVQQRPDEIIGLGLQKDSPSSHQNPSEKPEACNKNQALPGIHSSPTDEQLDKIKGNGFNYTSFLICSFNNFICSFNETITRVFFEHHKKCKKAVAKK